MNARHTLVVVAGMFAAGLAPGAVSAQPACELGPRVLEPSLNRIPLHYDTAPFEDIRLKTN